MPAIVVFKLVFELTQQNRVRLLQSLPGRRRDDADYFVLGTHSGRPSASEPDDETTPADGRRDRSTADPFLPSVPLTA